MRHFTNHAFQTLAPQTTTKKDVPDEKRVTVSVSEVEYIPNRKHNNRKFDSNFAAAMGEDYEFPL